MLGKWVRATVNDRRGVRDEVDAIWLLDERGNPTHVVSRVEGQFEVWRKLPKPLPERILAYRLGVYRLAADAKAAAEADQAESRINGGSRGA